MTGPTLEEMEETCRDIGRTIGSVCGDEVGFCLLLFDFGKGDRQWGTYVSNANREDMVRGLEELLEKIRAHEPSAGPQPG